MTSRVALGAVLLGAGALWLLSSAGALDLSYQTWIGLLLIGIGLAIALAPGRHGVLVTLGILILLAGLPALAIDDLVSGDVGDAIEEPSLPGEIVSYEHGVGKLTVDLTAPGLATEDLDVEAQIGIGELLVLVPPTADLVVEAHVGIGNVDVLGEQEGGVDVDVDDRVAGDGEQEITLELEAGIGDIRVRRD